MDLLDKFSKEWFAHPDWWFSKNAEYDNYIINTYSCLVETKYTSIANPLQKIIIYDQLPRHIYRNHIASHIIEYYLKKALDVVYAVINTTYYENLKGIEWSFFMLPLRHTKNTANILSVIQETWKKIQVEPDNSNVNIYKRFLKATYDRLLSDNQNQSSFIDTILPITFDDNDRQIFNSILHFSPSHYKSIDDVCVSHNLHFDQHIINIDKPIIISLSGGVDSMVCSYIIKQLFPRANVVAVHVSYDNRDECSKEISFLKHWCSHLNIVLYVRTITEIHREPCMKHELRDLYESYTREVRYNCYKSITREGMPQVIMGHNSDDRLENIMTNIAHKNKYENLYGMYPVSVQDNVQFIRPLLATPKDDIIDFALRNSIPYLPNSTPIWSQRGQIRNNIVPVLDKWNKGFVPSLYNLSDALSSLYTIMQNAVEQFVNKGYFTDNKRIFQIENISVNEVIYEQLFWKEVFVKLFNIYPSLKSLDNFKTSLQQFMSSVDKLNNNQTKKVMISKGYIFEVKKVDSVSVYIKVSCTK